MPPTAANKGFYLYMQRMTAVEGEYFGTIVDGIEYPLEMGVHVCTITYFSAGTCGLGCP